MWPLILLILACCALPARAEENATATKSCLTTPCDVTLASFSIATSQIVRWQASYTGGPTEAHSFFLSTVGPNMADIPLTTSGELGGERFLSPGTYHISIRTSAMGPGSYTVFFNRRAAFSVSPTSHSFGLTTAGTTTAPFSFSVSYTGDVGLTATVSLAVTGDSSRFTVSPTTGTVASGSPFTFQVRYVALTTATVNTTHNATITITGTSSTGPPPPPRTVTVQGTTRANVPDIDCGGGTCGTSLNLGSADGDVGQVRTFDVPVRNTGESNLLITSITLVNDTGTAFTYTGPTPTAGTPLTVGPSGTTNLPVSFAPPPGEANYCAHLVIQSNDPDEMSKSCLFRAVGHHPIPLMRVVTMPQPGGDARLLDYGDVELGFTFHKAIIVFNDGDADLNVTVADLCPPATPSCGSDATHGRWIVRQLGTRTVTPGNNTAFHMDYRPIAPVSAALDAINVRVTGINTVPANQTVDVALRGHGVAPIPIDTVLVLDRSGSMADTVGLRRKIEALQTAASMYVELLRPDPGDSTSDRVGLVRYDNENDEYLALSFLQEAGAPAPPPGTVTRADALDRLSATAITDIARLAPRGSTWIGGAMQRGSGMLPPGAVLPTERKQAMVVLTDGQENVNPHADVVLGGIHSDHPTLKIYSIGLGRDTGSPPEINATVLQTITNVTNGYHQVVGDLSGVNRFQLEGFYFKIFTDVVGLGTVVDPTVSINVAGSSPIVVQRAQIVSSDHSVIFMVLDDPTLRTFYQLQIVTPAGEVLTEVTTTGGLAVQRQRRNNYDLYKVIFPDEAQAANYAGEWQLRLVPNGTWSPQAVSGALQCEQISFHMPAAPVRPPFAFAFAQTNRPPDTPCRRLQQHPDAIDPRRGDVPVGFAAAVGSDYRMDVAVRSSHFLPTADVKLTASLTDRRAPALNGAVTVDVTTPGGTQLAGVPLFDDGTHGDDVAGDGTWTTHFIQTLEGGTYKFFFRGRGRNERGELAPREEVRYLTLAPLGGQNGGPNDGSDGKGRRPWFSFHLGHSFPLGSFRREFDSGPSVTVDVEAPFSRRLSFYGMFGYHYFHAQRAGDLNLSISNLSLNLRAYFPVSSWQGFVQFGPGAYFQRPGANKLGYNVGAGLDFPVLTNFAVELGADFHHVDPGGQSRLFFDPKLGIKFRF
ncbi:MAG TPA: choice-of-anchor X domain-containing protein [Pyrinomonadaceae bacterium]|jgi:hypothetical protein|nr:choice-of-anchor X domain-containing protein [Pyrinomonadaceae bacterium]